ncbi:phenoloxidase-activating factor 2-like [Chelonus insularis]|uniref:phenoloxidase-activating factor 2-like n=1 Tax=Chelonus insularis TaxID=460826 RepID=UPI00158D9255|nr:phenoloxidase-activating factor 2-like [Chelonus insularis]
MMVVWKSISFAVICLCIAYASAEDLQQILIREKFNEIQRLKFPQDPECGMITGYRYYNTPEEFDRLELLWMMSVSRKNNSKHLCDGVLIYPDVLMTTAHCVENEVNEDLIVASKSRIYSPYDTYRGNEERTVSEIHINPTYRACSCRNNLAILILSRPFKLDDNVKVVCLPSLNDSYYTGYCIKKLMEDHVPPEHERDHGGDRVFMASNSSHSTAEASGEEGNGTDVFIKRTQLYALSCGLSNIPKKFYYLGLMVRVEICGPNSVRHQFYDTIYKFLPWMNRVLKSRFIYHELNENFSSV